MSLIATDIDLKFNSSGGAQLILSVENAKDAKLYYDK